MAKHAQQVSKYINVLHCRQRHCSACTIPLYAIIEMKIVRDISGCDHIWQPKHGTIPTFRLGPHYLVFEVNKMEPAFRSPRLPA